MAHPIEKLIILSITNKITEVVGDLANERPDLLGQAALLVAAGAAYKCGLPADQFQTTAAQSYKLVEEMAQMQGHDCSACDAEDCPDRTEAFGGKTGTYN
jgi:hypothetical protein